MSEAANFLRAEIKELNKKLGHIEIAANKAEHEDFVKRGGCVKCGGRGWVVTWDTMDYMDGSAAEFAPCLDINCTPQALIKSGLDRSYYSKYDRNRGVTITPVTVGMVEFEVLSDEIAGLEEALAEEEDKNSLSKGKTVKVVKGRKTPVGTVGKIFWMENQVYHDKAVLRLGIKDSSGVVHWTYGTNVEIVEA